MADILLIILCIAIAIIGKKKNGKSKSGTQTHAAIHPAQKPMEKLRPKVETISEDSAAQVKLDTFDHDEKEESWRGSIEMTPEEPHLHEGKDPTSCPATEREQDCTDIRQHESSNPAPNKVPGLVLNFSDRQSILHGVVMSEVLRRPEFINGHRIIR